jgi:hypothetical protein
MILYIKHAVVGLFHLSQPKNVGTTARRPEKSQADNGNDETYQYRSLTNVLCQMPSDNQE